MRNVSEQVFEIIKSYNVNHIFYLPGGGGMYLFDALARSGIPSTAFTDEAKAGYAALGYAAYKNSLSVVLATSGPGATNLTTPCLAAWTESLPVLFITGQPRMLFNELDISSNTRVAGVQWAPIEMIAHPITKMVKEPLTHLTMTLTLTKMIDTALKPRRGPVWLSLRQDIQNAEYIS